MKDFGCQVEMFGLDPRREIETCRRVSAEHHIRFPPENLKNGEWLGQDQRPGGQEEAGGWSRRGEMTSILGNMGMRNVPTLGIMGSEIVPLDVSWDHQVPTTLLAKTGSQSRR